MTQSLLNAASGGSAALVIAQEALMQLENNMCMGNLVHRQYVNEFKKIGDTVTIRKPVQFKTESTAAITTPNDVVEQSTTITISERYKVAWLFNSQELTLTVEQYSERYIKPAMIQLANQVDADVCGLYKSLFYYTGVAGTTPAGFTQLADVAQKMDEMAVPRSDRRLVLDPAANWKLAQAFYNLNRDAAAKAAMIQGYLGTIANMDIYMDQNIKYHTKGTAGADYDTDGASQVGNTIHIDTGAAGTFLEGDIVTFGTTYSVNPISKETQGTNLMPFVITEDESADGDADLEVSPAANGTTVNPQYQNISTDGVQDGVGVTLLGSHRANMAFHKNALALVTVPLILPDSAGFKARVTHNGLSIRVVKDYNVTSDEETIRLDIMYGVKAIYPELGVRVLG